MRKLLVVTVLLMLLSTTPALAVTDGAPDGDGHPYVGLMIAHDAAGGPMWRCSGTLISPTLFLTAGHCTEAPAAHVEIWFDADVDAGRPGNGYPFTGDVGGTPYTHPDYMPNAFYLYDLGMVVLDTPMAMSEYGVLPPQDVLDSYKTKRTKNKLTFTAVGYGMQKAFPSAAAWKEQDDLVRMVAYPRLVQINGGIVGTQSLILSNNTNTGGTCFGDSGGPNFIKDSNVIASVTSFGLNGNCAGTGGVYRVDRADDLEWIQGEFGDQLP